MVTLLFPRLVRQWIHVLQQLGFDVLLSISTWWWTRFLRSISVVLFDVIELKSVHRFCLGCLAIWTVFLRAPCFSQFVSAVQVLLKSSFFLCLTLEVRWRGRRES